MKRTIGLVLLVAAAAAGAIYCGSGAPVRTPLAEPYPPSPEGAQLYGRYCALCHGRDGEGYRADEATALRSQDFLTISTDAFIAENTRRGRPGTPMSAWGVELGGALNEEDLDAVVAHIRTWQTEAPIDVSIVAVGGDAEAGAEPYALHCETCHGERGRGATAMTLNTPVFQETADDGFVRYTVEHGRRETKMPGFGDQLRGGEIDDVVRHVRSLPPAAVASAASAANPTSPILNPGNPPAEFELKDGRYVPADDVFAAHRAEQSFVLLDARPFSDYKVFRIEGAFSMPFYHVEKRLDELPKDLWIITYCGCPHAISGKALDVLRANGFEKSGVLDEGIYVWEDRGYPVVGK
jgi:cytochrome c oxidase cbb3-type subunit 3/ubiquinol-cytochrome c reductase cytochrome c subunit